MTKASAYENRIHNRNMILSFALTMFVCLLRICKANDIDISLDEIGTLAGAAYVSGYDWSSVLAETRYYGVGFYWLYGILFRYISDSYLLAIAIYVMNCICVSAIAILVYQMLVMHLKMEDSISTAIVATFPGIIYPYANWGYISNDVPVYCAYWIMIYWGILAYINKDNRRNSVIYSSLTALMMGYLLTVHEKSIAIWIAMILGIVLFKIIFDEFIVSPISFSIIVIISYVIARIIKENALAMFWPVAESLANTSAFSNMSTFLLNKPLGWKLMLDIIVSNFILLNEKSFGLISVVACLCVYWIVSGTIRVVNKQRLHLTTENKICFFMMMVSFIAAGIVVVGLAVQWGPGVYKAYFKGMVGVSTRAYGYLRYYVGFTGPAIVAICSMLKTMVSDKKKIVYTSALISIILIVYYYFFIHTYLFDDWQATSLAVFNIFPNDKSAWNIYLSLVILVIFIVLLCVKKREQQNSVCWVLMYIGLALMNVNLNTLSVPSIECKKADAGYELIKMLENSNEAIDKIYVEGNASNYQFMLKEYDIEVGLPEQDIEECIILSNTSWTSTRSYAIGGYGFYYAELDENEYIFVKGERYRKCLEEMGYELRTDTIIYGSTSYRMDIEAGKTFAIYDMPSILEKGTYCITYKVRILNDLNLDVYGYVDVVKKDKVYLNQGELTANLLDKNGEGEIKILISSDEQMEDVGLR